MKRSQQSEDQIETLYEHCRHDPNIQAEPLFWLQYSIFMQSQEHWDLAERHLDTAYDRGLTRPEFRTYQLYTNLLGLLIELESRKSTSMAVARMPRMLELLDKSREMIGDGNHRGHILKVILELEQFVKLRRSGFSSNEIVEFTQNLKVLVSALTGLSRSDKAEWGTEPVAASLGRAMQFLTIDNEL